MFTFDIADDPLDSEVRQFKGPLQTNLLVVGDFLQRLDNRPLEYRVPCPVNGQNFDQVRHEHRASGGLWEPLRLFLETVPAHVRVELMNASIEDLVGDFEDAPTLSKSGFCMLANPYNHQGMRPYAAILLLGTVDGNLLRPLGQVAKAKNLPILVNNVETGGSAVAEAKYVVLCPSGPFFVARKLWGSVMDEQALANITSCGGMPLLSLVLLTRMAHQILHIDYHRQCPSRDQDADAMVDILNGGLAARLRNHPEISAQISDFVWKTRPCAEATLSVKTPRIAVEDRIALQFEYA